MGPVQPNVSDEIADIIDLTARPFYDSNPDGSPIKNHTESSTEDEAVYKLRCASYRIKKAIFGKERLAQKFQETEEKRRQKVHQTMESIYQDILDEEIKRKTKDLKDDIKFARARGSDILVYAIGEDVLDYKQNDWSAERVRFTPDLTCKIVEKVKKLDVYKKIHALCAKDDWNMKVEFSGEQSGEPTLTIWIKGHAYSESPDAGIHLRPATSAKLSGPKLSGGAPF